MTLACRVGRRLAEPDCHELVCTTGWLVYERYWAARHDGIWRFREPHEAGDAFAILKWPPKVGKSWKWTSDAPPDWTMYECVRRPGNPTAAQLQQRFVAVIESVSDKVTVPAGVFKAIRVRITSESDHWGKTEEVVWLAAGVGPVKRVVRTPLHADVEVLELTGFGRGRAEPSDLDALVSTYLARNDPWSMLGKPDAIARLSDLPLRGVKSSFYRVAWPDRGRVELFRVARGVVHRFVPDTVAAWQELFDAEGLVIGTTSRSPLGSCEQTAATVARVVAVLAGAKAGRDVHFEDGEFVEHVGDRDKWNASGAVYVTEPHLDGRKKLAVTIRGHLARVDAVEVRPAR